MWKLKRRIIFLNSWSLKGKLNQAFPPGVPGFSGFSRISGSICTYFPSRSRSRPPSDFLYLALYPARTLQVRAPVKSRPT